MTLRLLLCGSLLLALACGGGAVDEGPVGGPVGVAPAGAVVAEPPGSEVAPPSSTPPESSAKAVGESADAKESRCSDAWSSCRTSCGDNSDCFMKCPHCSGCVEGEDCDTCPGREEACMSECGVAVDACRTECDRGLDRCRG